MLIVGQKFGKLIVVETDVGRKAKALVHCECGAEKRIRIDAIKSDKTRSCGCLQRTVTIGKRFGRLTILQVTSKSNRVLALCDCGNKTHISRNSLSAGHTKSCGCLSKEISSRRLRKHGMYGTPEWRSWHGMIQRCECTKIRSYKHYGARGITVCERWRNSFSAFYEDMGPRPGPGYSIERKDNNGNYEYGNCCWLLLAKQSRNRRNNRKLSLGFREMLMSDWARELGISFTTLHNRIRVGWPIELALTKPVRGKPCRAAIAPL